jgi:hypothetical protein
LLRVAWQSALDRLALLSLFFPLLFFSLTIVALGCFAMAQSSMLRPVIPFFVVSFFLLYFFSSGVQHELSVDVPNILTIGSSKPLHQLTILLSHPMAQSYSIHTA